MQTWQSAVKSSWPLLKEEKGGGENVPVPDIGEVFRASNSRVLHSSTQPHWTLSIHILF